METSKKETILVCGGAGYIGSHTVHELIKSQYDVIVFDNFSKGHPQAVPKNVTCYTGDILNTNDLEKVFSKHKIDAVMVI